MPILIINIEEVWFQAKSDIHDADIPVDVPDYVTEQWLKNKYRDLEDRLSQLTEE